jgi:quercetin dioxygenase-like cupin family protein
MLSNEERTKMRLIHVIVLTACAVSVGACGKKAAKVESGPAAPAADMHVAADLNGVAWGPAPPVLPPGAELAVMSGDPAATGFVSMRLKMPAGYVIPPHFHPTDEHVTVLSGSLAFGMGDKVDAETAQTVNPGGYFVAPAEMHHYASAPTGAIVQVDLMGPFGITYVNPADDPSKKGQ